MTKTRATHRLTCSGDTRSVRETLKRNKWTYDPQTQTWYVMLVDAHADRVLAGDVEFRRGLGGQLKGCRLCLDGIEVWRSKVYVDVVQSQQRASSYADQDGYGWNCDAQGNYAGGARIPGSSPDDRI